MARPDDGRKRTWRYRLNDDTILEVSAPKGATERQVRRRGRVSLVLGTLVAALIVVAVASADQIQGDADAAVDLTPHGNSASATQSAGTTVTYDFSSQIVNTNPAGNDVFVVAGACAIAPCAVNVSITRSGDWLATSPDAGTPTSMAFTAYETPQDGTIRVTVPAGTPCETTETMTVELSATATNGRTLSPSSVNLSYVISTPECAANTAPVVSPGGPYNGSEGAAVNLDGTVTDPDVGDTVTTAWSYSIDSADAGASCSFGDASAVDTTVSCTDDGTFTLTLTANDSVNPAVAASASLTLTNANPEFDSGKPAFASANVDCTTNTVTLNFGFNDGGLNDTHTSTINWGDGSDATTTALESASHTYNSGGPYTAVVNVTDDDNGTTGNTNSTNSLIVAYNTSGILQPVNDTRNGQPMSVFKYKSTIPVKIKIFDCAGSIVSNLAPTVAVQKINSSPPPLGSDEAASTVPPTSGTIMRFTGDPDNQYIYNVATKQLTDSSAQYRITITIQLGQTETADIGLKP